MAMCPVVAHAPRTAMKLRSDFAAGAAHSNVQRLPAHKTPAMPAGVCLQHRSRGYIVRQAPPVPPETCEERALRGPFTRPRRSEVEVVRSSCSLWLLGARRNADTRLAAQKEMLSGALPAGGRPNSLSTRAARWCPLQGRHAAHVRGREQRGGNIKLCWRC